MEITNNYMDYDDDEQQETAVETQTFLMMIIAGRDFALHFNDVVQIAQADEIFPVPEFPDYILGYTKVGDDVIPVVDMRKRFGFEERSVEEKNCIVVTKDENNVKQGMLVDAVRQLRQTEVSQIMPAPSLGDTYTKYVSGMFKRKSGSICYIIEPKRMYTLTAQSFRQAKKYRIKRKSENET